jgi:hypothetical protein
MIKHSFCKASI